MPVSAKDIAKKLNISPSAVSLALNDKAGVSEQLRRLVIDTAKEMGYDMGRVKLGSALKGRTAYVVYSRHGTVVGDNPFFADLEMSLVQRCRERGYHMETLLLTSGDDIPGRLAELGRRGMEGAVLLGTELRREELVPFLTFDRPLVVLDAYFEGTDACFVGINNRQGAYIAAMKLIGLRRGQPGYLRSTYPIQNFRERAGGFFQAVRECGLSTSNSVVHRLSPSIEGAYADMKALLASGEKTAACYFADNDLIAIGAMRALQEAGYRIPEDVGLIGFDNTDLAESAEPKLCSVNVPRQVLGRAAGDALAGLISSPFLRFRLELKTDLILRKSL